MLLLGRARAKKVNEENPNHNQFNTYSISIIKIYNVCVFSLNKIIIIITERTHFFFIVISIYIHSLYTEKVNFKLIKTIKLCFLYTSIYIYTK